MTTEQTGSFGIAFPGQGNKRAHLQAALDTYAAHPVVAEFLGRFGGDPAGLDFADTAVVQPATYATGIAAVQQAYGPEPAAPLVIGHSLGELTAAACAGILDVWDGFGLACRRGEVCRDRGRPGQMIAVMGARGQAVEWLRRNAIARAGGVLEVSGFNGARQTVLSGDTDTVAAAIALAGESALLAEVLPISGAFHSPLMADALPAWRRELDSVTFRRGRSRFMSTVDVAEHGDPGEVKELLAQALLLPVRWTEAVRAVRAAGIERLYDAGPGNALTKLGRRDGVMRFLPITTEVLEVAS